MRNIEKLKSKFQVCLGNLTKSWAWLLDYCWMSWKVKIERKEEEKKWWGKKKFFRRNIFTLRRKPSRGRALKFWRRGKKSLWPRASLMKFLSFHFRLLSLHQKNFRRRRSSLVFIRYGRRHGEMWIWPPSQKLIIIQRKVDADSNLKREKEKRKSSLDNHNLASLQNFWKKNNNQERSNAWKFLNATKKKYKIKFIILRLAEAATERLIHSRT